MRTMIFCGPTLGAADIKAFLADAEILPPVAQGDVYRAALTQPARIAIIDGYFDQVPSVWHKEILWAMNQGIHVYGAASMGALRASELVAFGMVGVGAIFEAFRDGLLEDDDEVSVLHGPRELDFCVCSDAMVNIRATLQEALQRGVISANTKTTLEGIAKSIYYPQRTYGQMLDLAVDIVEGNEIEALRGWLPAGQIDQKRQDALQLIALLRDRSPAEDGRSQVPYAFEETLRWRQLVRTAAEVALADSRHDSLVLRELERDQAARNAAVRAGAALYLARGQADTCHAEPDDSTLHCVISDFCESHALSCKEDVDQWLRENCCNMADLHRIARGYACLVMTESDERSIHASVLDHLRWTGAYATLRRQAQLRARTDDF